MSFLLALAVAAQVVVSDQPALTEQIAARDADFFETFFTRCEPERLRTMVTADFEMYHDKAGFNFKAAEPFIAEYARQCAERRKPDTWRSRRELVRSTLHVDPVPGYGAIQEGRHLFYERRGDGPEKLAGRARFVHLWKLDGGQWRLAKVLSYAHEKAE
jgi:hypothetical protein